MQADSKIIVAGIDVINTFSQVMRLNPNGTPDGTTFAQFPAPSMPGLVIQEDGKILVGTQSTSNNMQVARYNTDGSLDNSFGNSGIATVPVLNTIGNTSLALQPDGSIIISDSLTSNRAVLARFTPTGLLDASYGSGGVFTAIANTFSLSLILQADNKAVFAGQHFPPATFALGRVTSTGTIDTTWDSASINPGYTFAPAADSNNSTIQANGYIVATGSNNIGVTNFIVNARYISSPVLTPTTIKSPINNTQLAPGIINFSGTAQNPSIIYLFVDGILIAGTQTIGASDNWTIPLTMTSGTHTAYVVSIYQNQKLNIQSDPITFVIASPTPPIPTCVVPVFASVSSLVQTIINKYCCK